MDTFYSYLQHNVLFKKGWRGATCAIPVQYLKSSQIIPECNMILHYPTSI